MGSPGNYAAVSLIVSIKKCNCMSGIMVSRLIYSLSKVCDPTKLGTFHSSAFQRMVFQCPEQS